MWNPKKKNKKTKIQFIDTEKLAAVARGRGGQMGRRGQKVQTSRYTISKSRDVMDGMGTTVNATILYI